MTRFRLDAAWAPFTKFLSISTWRSTCSLGSARAREAKKRCVGLPSFARPAFVAAASKRSICTCRKRPVVWALRRETETTSQPSREARCSATACPITPSPPATTASLGSAISTSTWTVSSRSAALMARPCGPALRLRPAFVAGGTLPSNSALAENYQPRKHRRNRNFL